MNVALVRLVHRLIKIDHHTEKVVLGATVAFALKGLGAGLGFGFNMLLGRLLGAERSGIYYLALTVVTFSVLVGRVGLDNSLLRFTAANAALGDWPKVAGVYRRGMWIAGCISALVTVLVIVAAPWIAQFIFSELALTGPLQLMALAILPMSLLMLHAELLKGRQKIPQAMTVNGVGVPLFSLLLLLLLGNRFGLNGAVMAYTISAILLLMLGVGLWRWATPEIRGVMGHFDTRQLIAPSIPLFWISIINFVMNAVDTLLLGVWADSESVGIYGVAIRIATLIQFILLAVNTIAAPKFAVLYAQGNQKALRDLALSTSKLMTWVAALAVLPLMIAPTRVLGLFGSDFTSGATTLQVLAVGQFVNVAAGSVGPLLIMSGHEKVLQRYVVFTAIVSAVFNIVLVWSCGILGAAIARTCSLILLNLLASWAVYKHLGISLIPSRKSL